MGSWSDGRCTTNKAQRASELVRGAVARLKYGAGEGEGRGSNGESRGPIGPGLCPRNAPARRPGGTGEMWKTLQGLLVKHSAIFSKIYATVHRSDIMNVELKLCFTKFANLTNTSCTVFIHR